MDNSIALTDFDMVLETVVNTLLVCDNEVLNGTVFVLEYRSESADVTVV